METDKEIRRQALESERLDSNLDPIIYLGWQIARVTLSSFLIFKMELITTHKDVVSSELKHVKHLAQ